MIDDTTFELSALPVSASDTVGNHRHELRYFELSRRCLVLLRDIAEHATLMWDSVVAHEFFQEIRTILSPTTLEQRVCMDQDDAMSSLEMIHTALVWLHKSLKEYQAKQCH
jgi:hypothetical protein